MLFKDRQEAGRKLAAALSLYKWAKKTLVLGLPRGGVVVAHEVAKSLGLPLDVIVPRKIGAPHNPELAIGALAGDVVFLDAKIISALAVSQSHIDQTVAAEKKEAERRLALFRKNKPPQNFHGLTLLIVDDGIATGATMRASIGALKKSGAAKIVVAIPVGPPDTLAILMNEVDEVVCLYTPASFYAVGQFYDSFPQTTDEEVIGLLDG
jgi:putative phosphoribosyl transferase